MEESLTCCTQKWNFSCIAAQLGPYMVTTESQQALYFAQRYVITTRSLQAMYFVQLNVFKEIVQALHFVQLNNYNEIVRGIIVCTIT